MAIKKGCPIISICIFIYFYPQPFQFCRIKFLIKLERGFIMVLFNKKIWHAIICESYLTQLNLHLF